MLHEPNCEAVTHASPSSLCRVERLQTFEGEASPSPSRLLSFTLIPPAFTEKTFRAFFPTWGGRGQGTLEAASSAAQTCRRA